MKQISIGREEAIKLAGSTWWTKCTPREIALRQLETKELCMPLDLFHEAVEAACGHPVWTHESLERIYEEILKSSPGGATDMEGAQK